MRTATVHVFKLGKATVSVNVEADGLRAKDTGAEFPGTCLFRFDLAELARLQMLDHVERVDVRRDGTERRTMLADDFSENAQTESGETLADYSRENSDWPESGMVETSDVDGALLVIGLMAEQGGEFSFSWTSEGSAFWLHHDLAGHVAHDVDVSDGDASLEVDDWREERAHVEGARSALRAGVPLCEIVREIVDTESAFRERFDCECGALETFLRDVQVSTES